MKRLMQCLLVLLPLWQANAASMKATVHTQRGPRPLTLDIASTPAERETGLMHRHTLKNDGMLFLFPTPAAYRFWMKNTLIPLDMLFIDARGNIVYIEHKAKPLSLTPRGKGHAITAVIELDGGRARAESIAEGDTVDYALPESLDIR